ncbi:DUF3616 domain-containing protein [Bradyrhizobium sp.]|uniref:DUF3616 domain-containing protein n=1 Tax=Bradyrhizobium sp. TaxID=376 RepID=UPI002734D0B6|nr:DUF3616 domain-containing protein [Bradyrhizobium sp.]MDP3689611.1 DUF3616 domain-containing protein [Bradyrhizobium sp.]
MRAFLFWFLAINFGFAGAAGGNPAAQFEYKGLCEASGAAALDDHHFAVASDETNVILVYRRGSTDAVGRLDVEPFTTFDKSDIEAAARIGSRIYWISSHSFNKSGVDRAKRKLLFATDIIAGSGAPKLREAGSPFTGLRDALTGAAGVSAAKLNIEGLAATESGGLLIALRGPLVNNEAVVVPFENPADVINGSATPRFGQVIRLKLDGLGIRSIDRVGSGNRRYLLSAGPEKDGEGPFRLFWWSGRADDLEPSEVKDIDIAGIKPEALISFDSPAGIYALSDDDDICSDEGPVAQRRFRVKELIIP